jgi:hypothetical protein
MSEENEIKLTEEQLALIFKGIRPDDISKELFDALRRDRDKYMRNRLKGMLFHNSKTNGTYVKKS